VYSGTYDGDAWASGLFPRLPLTTGLTVCDLRTASPAVQLTIATLAGLVNRGPQRLYLIEHDDDVFWLSALDSSLPRSTVLQTGDDLLACLIAQYRVHLQGLVLYAPALPTTRNVASMLAALYDGLAVSPEQAALLQREPYGLPILADLRLHTWRSSLQVYTWAHRHLLPQCTPELLAGLAPTIPGRLRSFLVTQRVFTCWLDTRRLPHRSLAGWPGERQLFKRILSDFSPGSRYLGWFPDEPSGIRLTSRAALLTLASDHCTNLTIWSNMPRSDQAQDHHVHLAAAPAPAREDLAHEREPARKIYLSFTFSDGDNLQYCQHRLLHLWQDPARGLLPLGWTIAPALGQIMPALAAFYQRTASANDEFIAGPSGAAYLLPSHLRGPYRTPFLHLTARYMQAMHLVVLQVLDSNTRFSMKFLHPGLQRSFVAHLTPCGLRGILSGAGSVSPFWQRRTGLPIYHNLGLALTPRRTLKLIQRAAARGQRFLNVYVFAWQISPGDLLELVGHLDETFCLVTPGQLLELIARDYVSGSTSSRR
jgi:hypothetical protein